MEDPQDDGNIHFKFCSVHITLEHSFAIPCLYPKQQHWERDYNDYKLSRVKNEFIPTGKNCTLNLLPPSPIPIFSFLQHKSQWGGSPHKSSKRALRCTYPTGVTHAWLRSSRRFYHPLILRWLLIFTLSPRSDLPLKWKNKGWWENSRLRSQPTFLVLPSVWMAQPWVRH